MNNILLTPYALSTLLFLWWYSRVCACNDRTGVLVLTFAIVLTTLMDCLVLVAWLINHLSLS